MFATKDAKMNKFNQAHLLVSQLDYTNSWSLENESSTPNLETGEHCPDLDERRKKGRCGKLCPSELDIEAGHSSRTFPVRVWEHLGVVSGSTDSWRASHMGLDLSHHPLEKWGDLEKGQVPGSQRGEPPQKVERKGASERQEGRGGVLREHRGRGLLSQGARLREAKR